MIEYDEIWELSRGDRNGRIRMKEQSRYSKLRTITYMKVAFLVIALNIIFFPEFTDYTTQGNNRFTIYMNGNEVGVTDSVDSIFVYYREAKREIAIENNEMVLTEFPDITYTGEEVIAGTTDPEEIIIANMKTQLLAGEIESFSHSYSVKVNGTVVNVRSAQEVEQIFQDTIDTYDVDHAFDVAIVRDSSRELNVLTAEVTKTSPEEEENDWFPMAGAALVLEQFPDENDIQEVMSFDSFDYGITDMAFSEPIEVVEAYLPDNEIMDLQTARDLLTQEQETQQIYKVQSGDTLSEISLTVGLPLDDIIALNDDLENENSYIYVDQELLITVPEPELAVVWTETARFEEVYDLPIEYIYNDDWYTNQSETLRQPSAGYHEAVASITRNNLDEVEANVLYEVIGIEPVAKVVEIGTIIPPTYIKPISGGRLTSSFGYRNAPTAGASTYHKGVDWATPVGTPVGASSAGVVAKAGWASGYGYVVYINHPDGRQTRYGHLSSINVSVGDTVRQGQIIAYSGNTGRSTGPHLHFEILINGVQVNPLEYL
ncbi:MAG TPA: M23 family metallopeptidase [Lachnospiraceae bacterium]|nr:M23 family metallopeptidase [Lachnospiraceae bacterium]